MIFRGVRAAKQYRISDHTKPRPRDGGLKTNIIRSTTRGSVRLVMSELNVVSLVAGRQFLKKSEQRRPETIQGRVTLERKF